MIFFAIVIVIGFVVAVIKDPVHAITTILSMYLVKVLYDLA
jgi:hypothetical protein